MKSSRMLPVLALLALLTAALAAPSLASASEWTKNGKKLTANTLQWSDNGVPLTKSASMSISGSLGFEGEIGGVLCGGVTATAGLSPGKAGLTTKPSIPAATNCETVGLLALLGCYVDSASSSSGWRLDAENEKIRISKSSLTFTFEGECPISSITYRFDSETGLRAKPDNPKAISSLALEGIVSSSYMYEGSEYDAGAAGASGSSFAVSPSGEYGMMIPVDTVHLSGELESSSELGGISCGSVSGDLLLEPGSNGKVTSFDWGPGCETTGSLALQGCEIPSGESLGLPWNAQDEGSKITISGIEFILDGESCPFGDFFAEGSLVATPAEGEINAITKVGLGGVLETNEGARGWSGQLGWTPSGVYGL